MAILRYAKILANNTKAHVRPISMLRATDNGKTLTDVPMRLIHITPSTISKAPNIAQNPLRTASARISAVF
jgi:hypothetical protein